MKSITVNLPGHTYPIFWETDSSGFAALIQKHRKEANPDLQKHFVVTNDTIEKIYSSQINNLFPHSTVLVIKDGESHKNFTTVETLSNDLLQWGADRGSCLWAFGGGVVGDITGFLASVYMRGIRYFQIPTTLLSMVDSSVGGKTGVNVERGKNMLGTFYQPSGVFIHTPYLKTLNEREFKCGLSEVIKSALLNDARLFSSIEENLPQLNAQNAEFTEEISQSSVAVKTGVVTEDEKEAGLRAILNLGHTLAHALESYYNYEHIKHGEAVSVGTSFAGLLSVELGFLSNEDLLKINRLFENTGLMYRWSDLPENKPEIKMLIDLMKGDKKNAGNEIRFVMLDGIGKYKLPVPVAESVIKECLEKFICL